MLILNAPVLCPSEREFLDPIGYLLLPDVLRLGQQYGLVKVVPPRTWRPPFALADTFTFHTRLQRLSDLGLHSRCRVLFRQGLNRFWAMRRGTLRLRNSVRVLQKQVYYYDLFVEVERAAAGAPTPGCVPRGQDTHFWQGVCRALGVPEEGARQLLEVYRMTVAPYAEFISKRGDVAAAAAASAAATASAATPEDSDLEASDDSTQSEPCTVCHEDGDPQRTLLCDSCDNPFHLHCLEPPLAHVPNGLWYCDLCVIGTGEYGFEEEDVEYSLAEFEDMCREFDTEYFDTHYTGTASRPPVEWMEQEFWRMVESDLDEVEVRYGADIHKMAPGHISAFPMHCLPLVDLLDPATKKYINHPFNLVKLPFARGLLLNYVNALILGMTVPWIYVGLLFSTFCWHVEDHYTLSANYCHRGAAKRWYGIPALHAGQLEAIMRQAAPDLFKKQPDLLHQLVTLMLPRELALRGVPVVAALQGPNEFIVTYPKVYHAGFNTGFNVNEAVNFTMDLWVPYGAQLVADYRALAKENVFDFVNICQNVLVEFAQGLELVLPQLARDSLRFFRHQFEHTWGVLTKAAPGAWPARRRWSGTRLGRRQEMLEEQYLQAARDEAEPQMLCEACKLFVNFVYCEGRALVGVKREREEVSPEISQPLVFPTPSTPLAKRPVKTEGGVPTHMLPVTPEAEQREVKHENVLGSPMAEEQREPPASKPVTRRMARMQGTGKMTMTGKAVPSASRMQAVRRGHSHVPPRVVLCLEHYLARDGRYGQHSFELVFEDLAEKVEGLVAAVEQRLGRPAGES